MELPRLDEGILQLPFGCLTLDDCTFEEIAALLGSPRFCYEYEDGQWFFIWKCEVGEFIFYFDSDGELLQISLELWEAISLSVLLESQQGKPCRFFDYNNFSFCMLSKNHVVRLGADSQMVVGIIFQTSMYLECLVTDLGEQMRKLAAEASELN